MLTNNKPTFTAAHFFLSLILFLCVSVAMADPSAGVGNFINQVGEEDFSANVIRKTFGDGFVDSIGEVGAVESGNILGQMFSIFNTALLAVAMFYFGYQSVSSAAATAEDGQFMGQRFSTVWVPIRFTIGVASLVPMFGGFGGAQVIFMWFTKIGIGMANAMVIAGLSALSLNSDFFISESKNSQLNADDIAVALFKGHACVYGDAIDIDGVRDILPSDVQGNLTSNQITPMRAQPTADGTDPSYRIGFTSMDALAQNKYICGGVRLIPPQKTGSVQNEALSDYSEKIAALSETYESTIMPIAITQLNNLDKSMQELAKLYVENRETTDFSTEVRPLIKQASLKFSNDVTTEVQAALPGLQTSELALQEANSFVEKYGWLMLGSFYPTIATAQAVNANMTRINLVVITPGGGLPTFSENSAKIAQETESAEQDSDGFKLSDITSQIGQDIVVYTSKFAMTDSSTGTFNPIMEFKDLGDVIIGTGSAVLAAYILKNAITYGADGAAGEAGKAFGGIGAVFSAGAKAISGAVIGVLGALGPFIVMLIVALFFFGFMLSIYIPMLPFITWYGGVIGWFSSIIESLTAAPVGAFIHLDGEGQGMGQRTQHTYLFLMNVLLRPALMVFGFFAASLGVMILGKLLFLLFIPAMATAQSNSWTGLISILGYIFVFMSLALTMIHGAFNLIHIIPDSVISWAGGHISTKMGQDTDNNTLGTFTKGSGRTDNAALQSIGKSGGGSAPSGMPGGGGGAKA